MGTPGSPDEEAREAAQASEGSEASEDSQASGRRASVPLVAGVVVGVLVVGVIVLGVLRERPQGVVGSGPSATVTSKVVGWSAQAAAQLAATPMVTYRGTVTANGAPVQAELSVSRSGFAVGTLVQGAQRIELVALDGDTYLRAGRGFWRTAGAGVRPEDVAGHWAKAPTTMFGFEVQDFLAPASIAEQIRKAGEPGAPEPVAGQPAHRIAAKQGTYWVSATAPFRLLRAEGGSSSKFEVTTPADSGALFTRLRERVAALGGARDPWIRLEHGQLEFVKCNENVSGCMMRLPVTRPGRSGSGGLRAVMVATISADGRRLGSCTTSQELGDRSRTTLSCMVTSPAWKAWMRQAREEPGRHEYQAQAQVMAEAIAQNEVARLLAAVDREKTGS